MRISPFRAIQSVVWRALRQGWTREAVAWSCAWGVTIGVFPILGFTTATLAVLGAVARLNHAILQGMNYLVGPMKWALMIPCVRLGEWIFRPETPFQLSIAEFTARFRASPVETLAEFAMTLVHAATGWLLLAPLFLVGTWRIARTLLGSASVEADRLEEAAV